MNTGSEHTSGGASADTPAAGASGPASGFRHFHDQLNDVKQRLFSMSERAESAVEKAVNALRLRDAAMAEAVIEGDAEIDDLELEVEQLAISLLALQQPMARDLRFLVSVIKISSDLERVGDHAVNIAQSARRLADMRSDLPTQPQLDDMALRARRMLSDGLDAFVRADGALGRAVCQADDAVDALNGAVFRVLLTHMMEDPRTITPAIEFLLVSRNLERVADLATNIAEDAVFLAEGTQIKHHAELRNARG
jgi:phosphate transport system protein